MARPEAKKFEAKDLQLVPMSSRPANARQPIMAGNWKMNPATEADALNLANGSVALLNEMADTCAMDE